MEKRDILMAGIQSAAMVEKTWGGNDTADIRDAARALAQNCIREMNNLVQSVSNTPEVSPVAD